MRLVVKFSVFRYFKLHCQHRPPMNTKQIVTNTFAEILAAIFQCVNECPIFSEESFKEPLFEIEIRSEGKIIVRASDNDLSEADLESKGIPSMKELKTCLGTMAQVGATFLVQFRIHGHTQTLEFRRE